MDGQDYLMLVLAFGLGSLLVFGAVSGWTFSIANTQGQPSGSDCFTSYAQTGQLKFTDAAINAGGSSNSLSGQTGNLFDSSGNAFTTDNPGSLSSPVTTSGAYGLQSGLIYEVTSTGAYPIWQKINVPTSASVSNAYNLQNQAGQTVLSAIATGQKAAGTCAWGIQAAQVFAPGSGKTATTNVIAGISSSDSSESFATAKGGNVSTSGVTWTVTLNALEAGVSIIPSENVYSTSSSSVADFSSGSAVAVPPGGYATYQYALYVFANRTDINIGLAANSGLTIQAITNPGLTSATLGYVITGFSNECGVTTSSASTTCLKAALQVSDTHTKNKFVGVDFIWVGETQPGYGVSHATDPAVTGFGSIGAAAGIPSNFANLTPPTTLTSNAGAPTQLILQSYIVSQYT